MTTRDPRREEDDAEVSFEGIVDLGSMPPPASGQVDVHRAATAVSTMTDELVEEIRRARDAGFADEMPTRPGKDKEKEQTKRPSAPDQALPTDPAVVVRTPTPGTLPPLPPVSFAETIPKPTPVVSRSDRLWPRVLFFVITVAAMIVSALAARRYRDRLRR